MTQSNIEGVLERPGDADIFAIAAGSGQATFSLTPSNRAPNTDLALRLLDANGIELASNNPADLLTASLSYTLPAVGTYYLEVKGVGKGDPLGTGYTNYGSLGLYRLSASYPASGVSVPVASFTLSPETGTAPLNVTMTAQTAPDITTYEWTYGDGTAPSQLSSTTSKTYTVAGTYTVSLKVTNSAGLSSTASRTLIVNAERVISYVKVQSITLTSSTSRRGVVATATVRIVNDKGLAMSGASVSGFWSGLVSTSTMTGTTNNRGDAAFKSPVTNKTGGSLTFTVTGVTLSGYQFDGSGPTSGSLSRGAPAIYQPSRY